MKVNAKARAVLFIIKVSLFILALSQSVQAKTLVWEEEFDQPRLDQSIWTFDVGNSGFGNSELQTYTDDTDNVFIEDGKLVIQVTENGQGGFHSARLKTIGRMTYQYGTIEARIKLPDLNAGLWPAFWQLGGDFGQVGWPHCGEIDILEAGMASALLKGKVNEELSGAFHWWHESNEYTGPASYGQIKGLFDDFELDDDLQGYHTYGMTWTPTHISIWIDDEANEVISIDSSEPAFSAFNQPHFLILNMAVGGIFPDIYDNAYITAPMPAKMWVDSIRIYDNDSPEYQTQIHFAEQSAQTGYVGIFSEGEHIDSHLRFGTDAELYVWNNMQASEASTPAEGNDVLNFEVGTGSWYGLGVYLHDNLNMMHHQNGYLHFQMKTTHTGTIGIGLASAGAGDAWIDLIDGETDFGLIRDGQWHLVSIPLSLLGVDFNTLSQAFMLKGDAPTAAFELAIDDIYFSPSVAKEAPDNTLVLYSDTQSGDSTFELGLDGELYIWEDTLAAMPATPYEGDNGLSYQSTGAGWYGLSFTAKHYYDLSQFSGESSLLHFSMKTTSSASFFIGMKSGSMKDIGQKWIAFTPGSDPDGFSRDGQWHEVTIPMTDFSGEVDLSNVIQLFELFGVGNELSDIEIDHIYFTQGVSDLPEPGTKDLIAQAEIFASSEMQPAAFAIDANMGSRWESVHGESNVWLSLDLGQAERVNQLKIHWETANAKAYKIEGSLDNLNWTELAHFNDGVMGQRSDVFTLSGEYQFIRINAIERSTQYGYSIWELELTGGEPQPSVTASSQLQSVDLLLDGNMDTRWESEHGLDEVSVQLDLHTEQFISYLYIDWEMASAASYRLLGSLDGETWKEVKVFSNLSAGARRDIIDINGHYRYLTLEATERSTQYGYSIWEMSLH
ncbi:discoidin domain-containing protein [uncultured Shewanella sp.]|uniref:discoidin domain-containing protein n=1 Tax=uncultured Shewanella sp. TaxID=173975 RepID=UPI002617E11F|nr:discoidin domain-containing protein [uncultured Shewanella sp.]